MSLLSLPKRPMRLALMSSQNNWGGGEQFLWSLGMGLKDRGHEVVWISPHRSVLTERLVAEGVSPFTISGRYPSLVSIMRLRRFLLDHQIEILHLNDSHAVTWGTVSTLHRCDIHRVSIKHTNFPVRSAAKYNWFVEKMACVSATVFQTCIEGGILENKLRVITGSVPPQNWNHSIQRSQLAQKLKANSERVFLVSVGSLIECKGHRILLESMRSLKLRYPQILLAIFGEGSERADLEAKIQAYDLEHHVQLLGFQDRPEQYMAGADYFVHPALSEGLPLVAMQAQMQGIPMIASDVGGLSELLRDPDSLTPLGWIVPPNNSELLTRAIQFAIDEPEKSKWMAERGKVCANRRYSLERMLDEYEVFYQSVLEPKSLPFRGAA
ncbi:MAG: glycosyltransferase family 4 protein [Pirellulales bacterium]